jgi:hypothetical protein
VRTESGASSPHAGVVPGVALASSSTHDDALRRGVTVCVLIADDLANLLTSVVLALAALSMESGFAGPHPLLGMP